ncbi:hypothetical protein P4O66_019181 [Electrophorus voltai]|uniref:THAP-type domain-containing protein n=1 Tax=Electrophorus voltai TaxID=2609070 RepID=A0AAD8ZUZ4_9TELE|nr:hypothetical protein P4O66_019181 [Electrophorus voltai]
MPRHCSAAGCNSRDTREARKAGLTFHRLPKRGNPRRTTWILNSRRKGPEGKGQWEPQSDYIYFCSKHFTPDSFELSGVSGYHRLKDDAVPTVVDNPHQRGKVSRGRGRPRNVERQKRASIDKERSESKDVPVKAGFVQNRISGERAESSKTADQEQENEQALPLPLSVDVQTPSKKSSNDPAADCHPNLPSPRPPSPSCYMRRLPPPPGFYLAKEHSYAQLCPLLWRKRYNKAIDNLEKALRLLSAARRRENRLRLTLLHLRESRVRSTLSQLQDSGKRREQRGGHGGLHPWPPQSGKAAREDRSIGPEGQEESEMESTPEDVELFTEEGWRRPAHITRERVTTEEEEGCCFYCGRGREDEESADTREGGGMCRATEMQGDLGSYKPSQIQQGRSGRSRIPSTFRDRQVESTRNDITVEAKDCFFYYCEDDPSEEQTKADPMEPCPQQQSPDPEASLELCGKPVQQVSLLPHQTEMLLQMLAVPGPPQATAALPEATSTLRLQELHVLQPSTGLQLGFLLPDTATREGSMRQGEQEGGNRVYWVQERTDSRVLLVPEAAESRERNGVGGGNTVQNVESHSMLVAEDGFQQRGSEDGCGLMGLRHIEMRDGQLGQQSNLRTTVPSGDVRQRLKEHLEGFQLQLSSEFID